MSMSRKRRKTVETEALANPRQVRFQKKVEDELNQIAAHEGISFEDAVRMAARRGLAELRKAIGPQKQAA